MCDLTLQFFATILFAQKSKELVEIWDDCM